MCPFFDDGVSIILNSKNLKGTMNAVYDLIESSNSTEDDADYKKIVQSANAINEEEGVELYSGSASGSDD